MVIAVFAVATVVVTAVAETTHTAALLQESIIEEEITRLLKEEVIRLLDADQ
jgi:hypothetical protein